MFILIDVMEVVVPEFIFIIPDPGVAPDVLFNVQ